MKSLFLSLAALILSALPASVGQVFQMGQHQDSPSQYQSTATNFLKLDGFKGDSFSPSHKDEFEVSSYKWDGSLPKKPFLDVTIPANLASPSFIQYVASGQHIKTAIFTVVNKKEYTQWKLEDVLLTRYNLGTTTPLSWPENGLRLNFAKVTVSTGVEKETNPVPETDAISPEIKSVGDAKFNMTILGDKFIKSSVVNFNGSPRATAFVSTTELTATIEAKDLVSATEASITVTNGAPGGGVSNSQIFTIDKAQIEEEMDLKDQMKELDIDPKKMEKDLKKEALKEEVQVDVVSPTPEVSEPASQDVVANPRLEAGSPMLDSPSPRLRTTTPVLEEVVTPPAELPTTPAGATSASVETPAASGGSSDLIPADIPSPISHQLRGYNVFRFGR